MYAKTFVTAAIALVGAIVTTAPAFAGDISEDHTPAFTSTLTRAEVIAAALQARADGLIPGGEQFTFVEEHGPGLSRAQVRAETLEAIRLGAIGVHEKNLFPTAAQLESIRMAGLNAVPMTMASR
jgi:Domain of unknown function (DUF4148)